MSDKQLTIDPWDHGYCLNDKDDAVAVYVSCTALGFELDPEKHLAWIESQRPRPRYRVEQLASNRWPWDWVVNATATAIAIGRFKDRDTAHEYAAWLNEREADE